MTREFIRSFKSGSTHPSMVFLVLASLVQAAQFLVQGSPMVVYRKAALSYVAEPHVWAYLHITLAMLVCWRLVDNVARPVWAWGINTCMFGIWVATYISPAIALEDGWALLSVTLIFPTMAFWALVRTEATARDRANA